MGLVAVSNRELGGTYQFSLAMLSALRELTPDIRTVVIEDRAPNDVISGWRTGGCQVIPFDPPTMSARARRGITRVLGGGSSSWLSTTRMRLRARWLRRHQIDLLLFPQPTTASFETGLPFIMAVPDLQHRLKPEFPEVSADGEWDRREYLFGNAIRYAQAILVDSEVGREDVMEFYGDRISPDRIHVLPFVPPPYLVRPSTDEVGARLRSLGLAGGYLLLPAQFWPHKNHQRVAEAVALLRSQHLDVTVVMTGSATGKIRTQTLADLQTFTARTGIGNLVRILGYVDDETITALYAGARGVLLPGFFGPTNIPIIEGWAMGVPVLTSDIRGIREQCGDAAILVDPLSTAAIAEGMRRLWTDEAVRDRLVAAGTERVRGNGQAAFRDGLASILRDFARTAHTGEPQRAPG